MQHGAAPLLERHRIFHSRNVDEARAYLQSKEFRLDLSPRRAGELDTRINGVYLPGMCFGYFQYGPPVSTRAVGRDDYWIQLPIRGQIEVAGSAGTVICDTTSRCRPLADAHRLLLGAIQQRAAVASVFRLRGLVCLGSSPHCSASCPTRRSNLRRRWM
jgi:hypothetical protein